MNQWITLPVLWNSFVSSITSIPESSSTHTEPAAHPHGEPCGRRVKFPTRPGLMMSYCEGEEFRGAGRRGRDLSQKEIRREPRRVRIRVTQNFGEFVVAGVSKRDIGLRRGKIQRVSQAILRRSPCS
jgi:hypothetical protein